MLRIVFVLAAAVSALSLPVSHAQETKIVGSSTVSKFAHIVRDRMGEEGEAIVIETTGTGGGFTLFCNSNDSTFAPIALASREISDDERAACEKAAVGEVRGYDLGLSGVVIAQKRQRNPIRLTVRDLYLGLAAQVPVREEHGECALIRNPHALWSEVRPGLPNWRIEVYGPPLTSGTRSSFIDLALVAGAMEIDCMRSMKENNPAAFHRSVLRLRSDGAWIDAGENDSVLIAAITQMPKTLGILGYPLFQSRADTLSAVTINGVSPSADTIGNSVYPLSRVLRVYAKLAAVERNPKARAFLDWITRDEAIGEEGYLKRHGLIPLSTLARAQELHCPRGGLCSYEH